MSLPDDLASLLEPDAYPHPCQRIEVVETHISWVILTGEVAYKLKKPVCFPFVDFSTLSRREHFCREELRCNRRFAPSLYLDVVAVTRAGTGLRMDGDGATVDWAVKMRQFDGGAQLDRLLAEGGVDAAMLEAFGATLARQHAELPVTRAGPEELEERVLEPVRDNFTDVAALSWSEPYRAQLDRVRRAAEALAQRYRPLMVKRLREGWLRECHGDLHLSNLVLTDRGVVAFDCLEFEPMLRWIDPQSDVAFLYMDCLVRDRADLAYAFVDGYLNGTGDYEGVTLLAFYAAYRSMVRAKVAALRVEQAGDDPAAREAAQSRFESHLAWADQWLARGPGQLVLMCGLSGSGKSYLARRLAPRLPALRLRSDVARKALAGLEPDQAAGAAVGEGIYQRRASDAVYQWLAALAEELLRAGEHVIVDATFLEAERRQAFLDVGQRLGRPARVLLMEAPEPLLRRRVRERAAAGRDPSDADETVLEHQLREFERPAGRVVAFDGSAEVTTDRLEQVVRDLLR